MQYIVNSIITLYEKRRERERTPQKVKELKQKSL